jgi:hypothetical protein
MEKKICKKCNIEKGFCEFYIDKTTKDGIRGTCKDCFYIYRSNYIKSNKDKLKEINHKYCLNNKEKCNKKTKKYREKNKEKEIERTKKWKENNRENTKKYNKKYKEKNKEKILLNRRDYENHKLKTDLIYKLKKTLRNNITRGIKNKKFTTIEIIGCDYSFFKSYFESLFTEDMSWDKVGSEIHIDHIIPLCTAKTEEELYKLSHYTNLQPLWVKDNLSKGIKILS